MPGPFEYRRHVLGAIATVALVFAVLSSSLSLNVFAAQGGEVTDVVASEATADVLPVEPTSPPVTPEPTAIPPTAAPEPTEVPPTQAPVSTPVSTSVPTQAPTVAPTAQPTTTPAPTLTPTAPATGGISIQRIVAGSGCTQVSSTDIVPVGTPVEFLCNGANGPGGSPVTRTFSSLTPGWEYQVNNEPWRSAVGPVFTQSDTIANFTVRLRATAIAPTTGTLTVNVTTTNGSGGMHTTTMAATRQAEVTPTAADLQLQCSPSPVTVQVGSTQTVTCSYSARASLGIRQVTLTRVTVPVPSGWTITSPVGTVSGSTLTISPNTVISYNATSPPEL